MTKRTAVCYAAIFNFIENNVFNLEPSEFITDFEAGMRCAIERCYPTAQLRGCWYHYCAALRKRLLKLGLHNLLKWNSQAVIIKKELMSLPLLPSEYFNAGYVHIKKLAKQWRLSNSFKNFFEYYEQFWIQQNQRNPLSVCDANMRTTSSLESMNAVLRRSFPNHPHIFKFIDRLRLHEFSKSLDMLNAIRSDISLQQLRRRKKRDQARNEKLTILIEALKHNKSPSSFLDAIANNEEVNLLPNTASIITCDGFGKQRSYSNQTEPDRSTRSSERQREKKSQQDKLNDINNNKRKIDEKGDDSGETGQGAKAIKKLRLSQLETTPKRLRNKKIRFIFFGPENTWKTCF
ncbi:uncharacterized protein LOC116340597 [Contarinia nasturtii]|uniref:uncharacterized protein LOC116340597 n=1 Tax=Contarinia nasturtii TaxID=265458 RepID=UPI0012D3DC7B|nr:uncharacterized protein LOC116340597 [Contarinia nasturtii]